MKKYVVKGKNIDEILEKISSHFNIPKDKVNYDILKENEKEVELKVWIVDNEDIKYSEILIKPDGIFLKVLKTDEDVKLLEKYVILEVQKKEIKDFDLGKIKFATLNQGQFVKIAEHDKDYYIDAEVHIEILSPLEATIEIVAPKRGNMPEYTHILELIKQKGIIFGIRKNAIKTILENKIFEKRVVLAKGRAPIQGKNARLLFHYDRDKKLKVDKNNNVDFKNLNWIKNVKKDDIIVEKLSMIPGKDGINIFGKPLPTKAVKDIKLPKGKNTYISKDGMKLCASIDGQIIEEQNKISVMPILTINGDIDYSTGNIEFIGTVLIKGNVLTGFTVKASEDIIVEGLVEDAILEAERDVIVQKGIVANEEGEGNIKVGRDLRAKYIQNMKVKCFGKVIIDDYILLSDIEAKEEIEVISGKGRIIGGKVKSQKGITANIVGGKFETHTYLEIGVFSEIYQKEKEFDKKLLELEAKKDRLEFRKKEFMQKSPVVRAALKTKEKEIRIQLKELKKEYNKLLKNKENLIQEYSDLGNAKVQVLQTLNPGVLIKLGKHIYLNKEQKLHTVLSIDRETGELVIE
ncbi:hypothetical protein EV215_0490 [Hypnocyclicus thermotrophus]|uniref:RNA-binding protein KhpB N-terminal domain-containing protein n=1 Tax=Hypnocyclicus thermotrophus TaxID=1627895 RepID=A0AA46E006_9FUSO|nr:FapA family protein [Hypnocyclicus thermotrophus]TDT71806.1 hypothetical protein EV215_0490 [Hypnocyclicus thermotrophus]